MLSEAEPAAAVAASATTTVSLDGADSQTLLETAAQGLQQIKNLQAKFTQVGPSGNMTTGRLFLARPGRLRFEYDEPSTMLIVATNGNVHVYDSVSKATDRYPIRATPLRFLLSKEIDLDAAQVISVQQNDHGLKITLAAKDQELQGNLALVFNPETLVLEGWSFVDPNGEVTLVALDEVEQVKSLPRRLFREPDAGGAFLRDR